MKFDEDSLITTAQCLMVVNVYLEDYGITRIVELMTSAARQMNLTEGYLATSGFVLTAYKCGSTKEVRIKASIDARILADYLNIKD